MSNYRYSKNNRGLRYSSPSTTTLGLGMSFGSATIDLYTNKYPGTKASSNGTSSSLGQQKSFSSSSSQFTHLTTDSSSKAIDSFSSPSCSSTGSNLSSFEVSPSAYHSSLTRTHSAIPAHYSTSVPSTYTSYHPPYSLKSYTPGLKNHNVSGVSTRSSSRYVRYSRSIRNKANSSANRSFLSPKDNFKSVSKTSDVANKASADILSAAEEENIQTNNENDNEGSVYSSENESENTTNNDDDDDDPEFELKFISRSTSPLKAYDTDINCNAKSQHHYSSCDNQTEYSSISSIEQIIRPKKLIFGIDESKCHQKTQVNEADLCLNSTYTRDLSSKHVNTTSWNCHSGINKRLSVNHLRSLRTSNRYSAPVITTDTRISRLSPCKPYCPTSVSPEKVSGIVSSSSSTDVSNCNQSDSASDIDKNSNSTSSCNAIKPNLNERSGDAFSDISSDSSKSATSKMHINSPTARLSPRIIRRSINYRSPSPRASDEHTKNSTSATTSDNDDTESEFSSQSNHGESRNSSIKIKALNDGAGKSNLFAQRQHAGSYDNVCTLNPHLISLAPERCASAEPLTISASNELINDQVSSVHDSRRSSNCSELNESLSEIPVIIVNKLPVKIKDPYSTTSESESGADSEDEEYNTTVTIRLSSANSNNSETIISGESIKNDSSSSDEESCDEDNDNSGISKSESFNSATTTDDQESENEINKAISSIENEVTSLKESSTNLIHPRVLPFHSKIPPNFNSADSKNKDSTRDSGFSETLSRPESPYENVKPDDKSDSAFESKNSDKKSLIEKCQKELSAFISKCKDIDEMIGPTSPLSPTSCNVFQKTKLYDLMEMPEEDSVVIDASHVKVHHSKPMQSTVEFLTEEIDSSAVRIRENKAMSSHLSKSSEIEKNFSRQQAAKIPGKMYFYGSKEKNNNINSGKVASSDSLDDCTLQLYKFDSENNECDYGSYIDLEMTIDEQNEEFEGFTSSRKNALILRTQLSVRVHAIIEKLLNSSGRELRRSLFSLKQIFQDDKDLVHEFVRNDGLACLIKVGSEADQNYQNYILRALGQVMLYVDGMNGVVEHPETIQWLYTLISSKYRLVVKTALKLLLVFAEYADSNCLILINCIQMVDTERGVKPWLNIMSILNEKDSADIELLIFSMTLINKTLNGIPDQDTYYDVCDVLEEQGMERIIQHYMSKHGTDRDLLQQFRIYEAVLRLEDGDDDGRGIPPDSRHVPRIRKSTGNEEDRRKSKRHSMENIGLIKQPFAAKTITIGDNNNNTTTLTSMNKPITPTDSFGKTALNLYNFPPNINPSMVSNGFDDISLSLRKRRERDTRQKSLIREQEIHNQRSSISSCSSADSYGSYASYGSYVSNEDAKSTTLIDSLKNLDTPSVDSTEDDTDRSIDLSSRNSSHPEDDLLKPSDFKSSRESYNLWETTKKPSSLFNGYGNTSPLANGDPSFGLTRQPSLKEKKSWMLSMMYGKNNEECPKSPSYIKSNITAANNLWNGNMKTENIVTPSPTVVNDLLNLNKSSESVKCLKEKFIQQSKPVEPTINANLQRIVPNKEPLNDKCATNLEYLQWEQLVKQLSRPLLIKDLDFTDLRDDDDTDICAPVTNLTPNGPPVPCNGLMPPPPPPPFMGSGTPPPPPLPPTSTPTPPPPPRFGGPCLGNWSATNGRGVNTPSPPAPPLPPDLKSIQKNKKTIKLFWKEVKEDKSLLSRIMKKKTIWDEIKHISVDTQKLEHLFESRAKEIMNKKTQDCTKKNEILVLDTKRSNAINIGMTKLPPPRTIKTAILKMDPTIMNRDGIDKILTTMMPTEEEKNKILEAQMANPDVPLGQAESFLLTLSSITALEARLRLWAFKLDHEQMERDVAEPLMDLKQATNELEKSETFKIILGTLRAIGSFLNGVEAKGFQIDYLAKVPEIKDTVHKHSLLHHLCHMVMEKFPNTSDLYSELGAVSRASKVDFEELAKNLQRMEHDCKSSWEHLKVIAKHDGSSPMKVIMSEFLADCAERIIVLGIIHRRVMNRFKKFLVFLGMSSSAIKEIKPNALLKIISEFALEYRTTRERVKEQLEKKANHRERNKTRGKMITEMDKFKTKEQQADQDLKKILSAGSDQTDHVNGTKWGTLPGTKLRRPSTGSMNNLSNINCNGNSTNNRPLPTYRHSVHIETYTEGEDEILESLVRSTTQQPLRNNERSRRKARYGDRKSLRRTLRGNLDLSEEERLMLSALTT